MSSKFVLLLLSLALIIPGGASVLWAQDSRWDISSYAVTGSDLQVAMIGELRPLQEEIGRINALEVLEYLETKAKEQNTTVVSILTQKPINVVRMPDGNLYIIDGHHRAYAIWSLGASTQTQLKVKYDLSNMDFARAAEYLHHNALVYFSRETREKIEAGKLTPGQALKLFAPDVGQTRNSDWRSFIGAYIFKKKIDSLNLKPFAEFLMIDRLTDILHGKLPNLDKSNYYVPEVIERLTKLLDQHIEDLLQQVKVNPDPVAKVQVVLDKTRSEKKKSEGTKPSKEGVVGGVRCEVLF